jgi:hypothetical protein
MTTRDMHAYQVDREARQTRRRTRRTKRTTHVVAQEDDLTTRVECVSVRETSIEEAEQRQIVAGLARAYIATVEFHKEPHGGSMSHTEAVAATAEMQESRRKWLSEGVAVDRISWGDISAAGEANMQEALNVWMRVREAACDELEIGRRAAQVGDHTGPWALAQFLAIRDAFADQWKPQGGIESALIDMLTIAFSLQMYWSTIAHDRATRSHDSQREILRRFENDGWKSPFKSEAEAVEQAYRLADGYNRQFLRVLRQMRDLRRYAPPVIVNNGGQVNVGNQQVNVNTTNEARQ